MLKLIIFLFSVQLMAQLPSLEELSRSVNKDLPEVYDPVTKLMRTTVENNHFKYHFIVNASKEEFQGAFPKVKAQILKTLCSHRREKMILTTYKTAILYSYENVKGQSLGEFMVSPGQCR